jgi:hypothetical protein
VSKEKEKKHTLIPTWCMACDRFLGAKKKVCVCGAEYAGVDATRYKSRRVLAYRDWRMPTKGVHVGRH